MSLPVANILHLEDSDLDAELVRNRLEKSGLSFHIDRVSDRKSFVKQLQEQRYDVIVSDYQVPTFDGLSALDLAREHQPDVPFIFVSGAMGEELAVESLKRGATDYVLKDRLTRLGQTIVRAMTENRERQARVRADDARIESAKALLESETRLQLALAAGKMGTWDLDLTTGLMICSDTCKANYGRAATDTFTYAELAAAVLEEDRPRWHHEVTEAIARTGDFTIEYRTRWPDQSIHWIQVRGGCLTDAAGKAVGLSGISIDITNRKLSEEQARRAAEANAKFRTMFEQGTQFAGILSLDGTLIEANRLCLDTCGFTRHEVIGKPFWECGWWNRSKSLMASIRAASLAAAAGHTTRSETIYFVADGSERVVDLIISPVKDESGRVLFVACTGTDITERERAERRQRFLVNLATATQPLTDPGDVTAITARMLGEYLGADRCAYAEVENETVFVITGNYTRNVPSIVGRWPVDAFGPELVQSMAADLPFIVDDVETDRRAGDDLSAYRAATIRAVICIPLHKAGKFAAAMAVHQDSVRHWTPDEVDLVQLVVARCWESLERMRVMRALTESELRFRQLAETIPNLAWMARPDGSIFWYNKRWHEYTGIEVAQMEREGWQCVFHPDVLHEVIDRWQNSIATGQTFNMVIPLRGGDGVFRPFLTLVNPLCDAEQNILLWFGTNTDISAQTQAQEELARSAAVEKLRSQLLTRVAQASKSINAVLSVDGIVRILAEEARQIIGTHVSVVSHTAGREPAHSIQAVSLSQTYADYQRREVLPHPLSAYVCRTNLPLRLSESEVESHPEWTPEFQSSIPLRGWLGVPLIGHGGDNLGLIQLSHKESGEFTTEDEAVLLQLAAIATVGMENARLYERLREQDQRKDEFLATLAHELRNPLAPIRNGLTVLKMTSDEKTNAAAREMMERQVGHMVRLIDDLLDISRITRGKVELRTERIDVRTVLEAALEVSRPLIEAGHHNLIIDVSPEPLMLIADLTRVAQIVSNLLNNAAKYTPDHGRIELSTARDGNDIVISVKDNGVGVTADMLPRIFEMFTQVGRSLDRAQGGLGIGLALVSRLVEMHGGSISGQSAGLGQGSTFVVRLPLAPAIAASTSPIAEGPRGTSSGRRAHRILVVDDNVDGADSLATLIRLQGNLAITAYDGPSALTLAARFTPEVVILDIGLPGMSGYEVARKLRGSADLKGLTLIALTGWGTEEDRRQARAAGFDYHLVKPVEASMVTELLDKLSATASLTRD